MRSKVEKLEDYSMNIIYSFTYLDKLTICDTLAVWISVIDSKSWHVSTLPLIY